MDGPDKVSPEPAGPVHAQAAEYTQALLGSLARQHQAAMQQAAQENARQAVLLSDQAKVIEELSGECERLRLLIPEESPPRK